MRGTRISIAAGVCLVGVFVTAAWAEVTATPLARGTVEQRLTLTSTDLEASIARTGHNSGSSVDEADIAAALRRVGHSYGSRIDGGDVDVLVSRTGGHRHIPSGALDTTDIVMVQIDIPAGESIAWHRHPGPAIVAVASGNFEFVHEDCSVTSYRPGSAFVDEGTDVHTGRATAAGDVKVFVTFLVPEGAAPTVPAEKAPTCG